MGVAMLATADYLGGSMKSKYSNILIIGHTNRNIGDVCHNMSILKPLRLAFPDAKISILTSPVGKIILDQSPYLSEMFVLSKRKKGTFERFKEQLELAGSLRERKFDLVINLKSGSYFGHFLGAPVWSMKKGGHIIDMHLDILRKRQFSVNSKDVDMKIVVTVSERTALEDILRKEGWDAFRKTVVFAPFSNWHAKEWNLENFARLAQRLTGAYPFQIVFVGGEEDRGKMKKIEGYQKSYIDLVGKISLRGLAALYEKAMLVVGMDSGPFHLAGNQSVPAIGIFAPTDHRRYGSYWTRDLTVYCEEDLGCNPCSPGKKMLACGVYHRTTPCMERISIEKVYKNIIKFLSTSEGIFASDEARRNKRRRRT